ncbi:MAG: oligoribonuclease NrnB/cAMP/cGMP phosphodiesterase (DHH superfamily) [Methanobacteriota archaeon]|jgi:oligoribonuclease NrnB/cAMP/cGMP phosphodiesterase (DHH superfamily)
MEESLYADDELTVEERSLLPSGGFFVPEEHRERRREEEFEEDIVEKSTVMLVDGDADGLASVVLGREVFDDLGWTTGSPNHLGDAFERLAEHTDEGATVYVVDLCPDADVPLEGFETVVERASAVHWYDHHKWDDDVRETVEAMGVDVVVGESDEVCSADVTLEQFESHGHVFDDAVRELVAVTRDHDLWIRDDPRSDDLADLSVYLSADEYVEAVEDGVELDDEYAEFLAEKREEKNRLVELAVERATFEDVGGVTVAHTYGRCSQNEVAEALREEGADASVVVKPEGGTSLRGTDGFERCHEVARLLDGGGHPKAAGCKPDIFGTVLDYARHWTTDGEEARGVVLDAFEELLDS